MKPLFLFLAILLATEPVVSVSCWMNGQCRLVCKDDEENVIRCPNRKRCCILSRYLTMEPVTIDGILPWTTAQPTSQAKRKRQLLRCLGDKGICRTSCKKTEHPYLYCRDYRPCCLQSYMRINTFSIEDNSDWR